jgi:hypothetical protein
MLRSLELRERKATRHFHRVLVRPGILRGNSQTTRASHAVAIPVVNTLLRFIAAPP